MREIGSSGASFRRRFLLGLLALAAMLLPDPVFSPITLAPWEVTILRFLALVGISLVAVLPWVGGSGWEVRRRLRRWTIPGMAATAIYLLSTNPIYLIAGFCLLTGAAVDVWMTRAHLASETIRVRLMARERFDR